jgi:hypothetical protein
MDVENGGHCYGLVLNYMGLGEARLIGAASATQLSSPAAEREARLTVLDAKQHHKWSKTYASSRR